MKTIRLFVYLISILYFISFSMAATPINAAAEVVKVSKKGGTYNEQINVTFSIQKGYTVYYTTDNSTPTLKKAKYSKPIPITKTTTIKYIYINKYGKSSKVYSETYSIIKIIKPLGEDEFHRVLDLGDISLPGGQSVKCITSLKTVVETLPREGQVIRYVIDDQSLTKDFEYYAIWVFRTKCWGKPEIQLKNSVEQYIQAVNSGKNSENPQSDQCLKEFLSNSAQAEYDTLVKTYGAAIVLADKNKKAVAYCVVIHQEAKENPEDENS